MTIETMWGEIRAAVARFESPADGTMYAQAADSFSFELDPSGDHPSWYIEPPQVDDGVRYVGGDVSSLARCSIWLSRPRGDDPDRAALTLATDAGELRRLIDEEAADWFLQPGASVRVSSGDQSSTTVIGALTMLIDFEAD